MFSLPGIIILECLHEGGNSRVYRGKGVDDGASVIVKTSGSDAPSIRELAGLRREYEIAKSLGIDGVVRPISFISVACQEAIVYEDFGGISLSRLLAVGPIALDKLLQIFIALAHTVAEIHQRHVVHKDIKPSNIIVNLSTSEVKLADFRIASLLSRERVEFGPPELIEGTPAYMAPEQTGRMNRGVDHRADLYGLGVTMYEAFTGALPFLAADALDLLHAHIAIEPEPPQSRSAEVPEPLGQVILKLLAKNAENRYQSGFGLEQDLGECLVQLKKNGRVESFTLGRQDIYTTLQLPERLYGREAELATVFDAFNRCRKGAVDLLLVSGAAGIGKSAMVSELQAETNLYRGHFATGKFDQLQQDVPYSGISQAFGALVRQLLAEGGERTAAWSHAIAAAVGTNGQVIVDLVPEVEFLLGPQPALPPLPPGQEKNRFHLVFTAFVKALAVPSHPLVIFLDDLQWAEAASLELIAMLMAESALRHLLLVGAFRDQEIGSGHALRPMLAEIKKSHGPITTVKIGPLPSEGVAAMLADLFHCSTEKVAGLTGLLMAKTHGNPFFFRQILTSLYRDEAIFFDPAGYCWCWDEARIKALAVTDNVVELLGARLADLPVATREVLATAAAVGSRFSLDMLATACGIAPEETATRLFPALEEGLVEPLGGAYKYVVGDIAKDVVYCFAHDRVQQAAYGLIPEGDRPAVHLTVGRLLFRAVPPERLADHLFDIVAHLNNGSGLLTEQQDRRELAGLNLAAARKAKTSTAYGTGRDLCAKAMDLLTAEGWETDYIMFRDLSMLRAECEYMTGRFEPAEALLAEILANVQTPEEKSEVYGLKVTVYLHLDRREAALMAGLKGLALLGVRIPRHPPKIMLSLAFVRVFLNFLDKPPEAILDLPPLTDSRVVPIVRFLTNTGEAAYFVDQNLFGLISLITSAYGIRHGLSAASTISLTTYAIALLKKFGAVEKARAYAEVTVTLSERQNRPEWRCRSDFLVAALILHWSTPYSRSLYLLARSSRDALASGDFTYAGYASMVTIRLLIAQGRPIQEILGRIEDHLDFVRPTEDQFGIDSLLLIRQFFLAQLGKTKNLLSFDDETYDEEAALADFSARANSNLLFHYHLYKGMLLLMHGDFSVADANFTEAEKHIEPVAFLPGKAEHLFYQALTKSLLIGKQPWSSRMLSLLRVFRLLRKLSRWSQSCPENFRHKYLLVAAEVSKLRGQTLKAAGLYEQAAAWARKQDATFHEAVICERAGTFYLGLGQETPAKAYIVRAKQAYGRWGGVTKVKALEKRYPDLAPIHSSGRDIRTAKDTTSLHGLTTTRDDSRIIDLVSVVRASQEISGEVVLTRLLERLMRIVLNNAGAQRGVLLLIDKGRLLVKAEGTSGSANVGRTDGVPLESRHDLPCSVIEYALKAQETVVLDNAANSGMFMADPAIVSTELKSVLCMPLVRQAKVIGILYLENRLAEGVFTAVRVDVLEILAAQIAISIENATLYANLEEKVQERTSELEEALARITHISNTDGLTGIPNRRYFLEQFDKELERAQRYQRSISFIILDIDFFKKINDTYGHQTGDLILKELAGLLTSTIRRVDFVGRLGETKPDTDPRRPNLLGRLGGEEFAILLPETPPEGANAVAERLRKSVESAAFTDHTSVHRLEVTVSLGCCSASGEPYPSSDDLYSLADQCLYRAKHEGRNRAVCVEYAR